MAACPTTSTAADLAEQETHLLARQLLIVYDDGSQSADRVASRAHPVAGTSSSGMTMRAQVPFTGHAVELQLVVGAVNHLQPLVDVAQPDAAGLHPLGVRRR